MCKQGVKTTVSMSFFVWSFMQSNAPLTNPANIVIIFSQIYKNKVSFEKIQIYLWKMRPLQIKQDFSRGILRF